jgi:hypothetical protein
MNIETYILSNMLNEPRKKLDKFLEKNVTSAVKDLLVWKNNDGTYNIFGNYKITLLENGLYKIDILDNPDKPELIVSSLKTAVTWCIFEKNKKYKETRRIIEIDSLLGSLDVGIAIHRRMMQKSSDIEDKLLYSIKLNEEKLKKKRFLEEIKEYVNLSKYWQNAKFKENRNKF